MATLYVLQGPDRGRTFDIRKELTTLGRKCEGVPLTDSSISRRHAELRPANGSWYLEDLGSTNGTYVNGERITASRKLKHGDQIKIGGTLLVYGGDDSFDSHLDKLAPDMVDHGAGGSLIDPSIVASLPSNEDSVILAAPETAQAVQAWRIMYQLAEAIGAIVSPDEFLIRVMDILFERLNVDRGFILTGRSPGDPLEVQVVRYRGKARPRGEKAAISRQIISKVVDNKEGILCTDAMSDERFTQDEKGDSIHKYGLRSVICVPIMSHDEVQGAIYLDNSISNQTFTTEQLRLTNAIGHMTGMAIENARLIQSRVENERLAATGETVACLSHYIRNILQGLRSGADLLESGLKKKRLDTIGQAWQILQHNLEKTYDLTTNMLAFSKSREPRIVQAQVNKVAQDAVDLAQRRADGKGVMLLTDMEDMPPVPIDVDGIHQVVLNLVNNAIDAAPAGRGMIHVRTHYHAGSGTVTVSVTDNGEGVPPERLKKIFEPFHSTKGQAGTGLGLSVAKKIVTEHGGILEAKPEEEGITFIVTLPSVLAHPEDSAETHAPAHR